MIDIKSIQSLTDFKRNTTEHLERLHKSGRPLVLTVNGRAECVVLDIDSYQEMVERLDMLNRFGRFRQGSTAWQKMVYGLSMNF